MILNQFGDPYDTTSSSNPYSMYTSYRDLDAIGMRGTGPNTELSRSLSNLRNVSRKFVDHNAYASGAAKTYCSNMIGSGIKPRWQLEDSELKKRLQDLWAESSKSFNFNYDNASFYTDQYHCAHDVFTSGEVFVKFIHRKKSVSRPVPFSYQMLDADHCDENYNESLSQNSIVKMGIEFDRYSRRKAYHLYREHPNDIMPNIFNDVYEKIRIPKKRILHIGLSNRLGAIRYKPWLSPVLVRLWQLDNAVHNELERRKTVSLFGGVLKQHYGAADTPNPFVKNIPGVTASPDSDPDEITIPQGAFVKVPPGYEIQIVKQEDIAGAYIDFLDSQLKAIAKGLCLTYEQLTGDLKGVTYSSIRAGLLEFRRLMKMYQRIIMIEQFCQPILQEWLISAVLSEAIQIDDFFQDPYKYFNVLWQAEAWSWIDPENEQKAEKEALRNGTTSLSRLAAEKGDDIELLLNERAEINKMIDNLDIVLDSDPRKTASNGSLHSNDASNTSDISGDSETKENPK